MSSKFNKEFIKSGLRALAGLAVGVALYLSHDPKFAALGAIVPFILRVVDPTDKSFGFGKKIAETIDPIIDPQAAPVAPAEPIVTPVA